MAIRPGILSGLQRFSLAVVLLSCPLAKGQDSAQSSLGVSDQKKEVVALYTDLPIKLDGVLDEPPWQEAEPATDFLQMEPNQGQPATERTEVRILYDSEAIYFGVDAYDSEPDGIIINSLQQDFTRSLEDGIAFYLDTFDDNLNAFVFYTNPAGAKGEQQSVDEGREFNTAWEDVWEVKTAITTEGWLAEVRIPFKSLRFPKSEIQSWGINIQRKIRRKNEQSFWSFIPRRFDGLYVSFAGDLKGVEGVHPGKNFKLKPFVTGQLSSLATDDFDSNADVGLDLKYSLTSGLTLDGTVNTDFSQIEVDVQQINLTRFSLFFPEKRDFFLENAGIFVFGQTGVRGAARREFLPFFSRRIGLASDGTPVPILAGGRLTGRVGKYSLGFLNMQTRESGSEPANNFTVLRVKRNILSQSEMGGLFINRQSNQSGDYNRTFGLDAKFRLWENLRIDSFLAGTRTPGLEEEDLAGRIFVEWKTNLVEARSGYLSIGENFNAEVGFVPRVDIRKSDSSFGLRPRPKNPWIRELFPNLRIQYITDHENRLLTRITELNFQAFLHDGGIFSVGRVLNFERLDQDFSIRQPISIDSGDYNFNDWFAEFRSNPSTRISGIVRYESGDFWDGERKRLRLDVSFRPNYKFALSARYQWDDVKLQDGAFTDRLVNMRVNYSFNTEMFFSALIQYNSDRRQISSNLRFNLIHRPLSDLFIVYAEQRDAFQEGLSDKTFSLKYTYMVDLF